MGAHVPGRRGVRYAWRETLVLYTRTLRPTYLLTQVCGLPHFPSEAVSEDWSERYFDFDPEAIHLRLTEAFR